MKKGPVLMLGSGHLAYRVKKLLDAKGYEVTHVLSDTFRFTDQDDSVFDRITEPLKGIDLASLSMVYLLDDQDEYNLQLMIVITSLKKDVPMTMSLFNDNLTPHLKAAHPNLTVLDPARIAAPIFVDALSKPVKRFLHYDPVSAMTDFRELRPDNLFQILLISFAALIAAATTYFHFFDHLTWLNSVYFVVITITTVGYGDINLLNTAALSKVVDIVLILCSTFFIWMIFSLTIDGIIKRRTQLALGRKKYSYRNHVIVCGLGRLGYFVAEELIRRGERIILVESNEQCPYIEHFRQKKIDVYIGDARLPRVLQDVGVKSCQALISVISNDFVNIEIGLNARSFQDQLRLVLRIFDHTMAQKVKENLDIHLTLSMSAIADEKFLEPLEK